MMSTITSKSILWQAQEVAAEILNNDSELSGKITFYSENQRDIDFAIKNALGRQGIVGIVMTPTAQYSGATDEDLVWDLRGFTVQIVENPAVNRAIPTSTTALDAAMRSTDLLSNPLVKGFVKYNPISIEQGEDTGLLVAQAKFNCTIRATKQPTYDYCYAVYTDGRTEVFKITGNVFGPLSVNKSGLRRLRIQEGIVTLAADALRDATDLEVLQLPSTLTSINSSSVKGCVKLTEVEIPNGVTTIGDHAFANCSGLKKVTIPASVTMIDEDAFYTCTAVDDVYCYPNPANLTWDEEDCDDFKDDGSTLCHVKATYLSAYQTKFNRRVNVTFVGDL